MAKFGEYINAARTEGGLSLQDVADRAGLTKTHVWEIENGRATNPTIETLCRLAIALDLNMDTALYIAASDAEGRLKITRVQHSVVAK